jgi:ATP-dependent DNA helicase RecG
MIKSNPSVTHKEMAVQLNLREVGIRYHTDKLKTKGILQRIGGKKGGRWEVSK